MARREILEAWEALFRAQVSVMRDLADDFESTNVSMTEYDVLFNLSRLPERSARLKDLNRFLLLSQPSLSRLTDRLTSRGLVTKESAPGDARGVIIRLTPEGYSEFRRIGRMHADAIERRIDGRFTSDELKTLNELCNRLRSDLPA